MPLDNLTGWRAVLYVSSPLGSNVTVRTAWLVASLRAEPVYGEVQVPSAAGCYRPRHASSLSNLSYSPAVTRPSSRACLAASRSRRAFPSRHGTLWRRPRTGRGCSRRMWCAHPWARSRAPPRRGAFAAPVSALRLRLRVGQPAPCR